MESPSNSSKKPKQYKKLKYKKIRKSTKQAANTVYQKKKRYLRKYNDIHVNTMIFIIVSNPDMLFTIRFINRLVIVIKFAFLTYTIRSIIGQ